MLLFIFFSFLTNISQDLAQLNWSIAGLSQPDALPPHLLACQEKLANKLSIAIQVWPIQCKSVSCFKFLSKFGSKKREKSIPLYQSAPRTCNRSNTCFTQASGFSIFKVTPNNVGKCLVIFYTETVDPYSLRKDTNWRVGANGNQLSAEVAFSNIDLGYIRERVWSVRNNKMLMYWNSTSYWRPQKYQMCIAWLDSARCVCSSSLLQQFKTNSNFSP